jgi:5-methylcytosine-specific restriction endonuclease McrA
MYKSAEAAKAAKRRQYLSRRDDILLRVRKRNHERRDEIRAFINSKLAGAACADCGEGDPIVLDFDHIGPKAFNIAQAVARLKPIAAIADEISKCEVRCANCHRRKTHLTHGHRPRGCFGPSGECHG